MSDILILIHLLLGIIGYSLLRKFNLKKYKSWTKRDRNIFLPFIFLGLFFLMMTSLLYLLLDEDNNSEESKW